MSARDDFGSNAGRPGGYGGGAGGLGNGGVGGGMGGGGMGGGAARNGGIGSQTGLTTGNKMLGGTAYGRPGGMAANPQAWGRMPAPAVTQAPLQRPTVPGLLNPEVPVPVPVGAPPPPEVLQPYDPLTSVQPPPQAPYTPPSGPWPGQSAIPNNPPTYTPSGANPAYANAKGDYGGSNFSRDVNSGSWRR